MATKIGKGMNKEKLVCCCAIALLAACALLIGVAQALPQSSVAWAYHGLFGSVPPKHVAEQAPFTVRPLPTEYRVAVQPPVRDPADVSRNTPFVPPPVVPPPDETKTAHGGVVKGGSINNPKDPRPTEPVRPTLLDGTSPVAYMGVLGVSGQRYGMLRVKDGHFRNVREGDELTDLGCTIVRVEQEAIHLLTRKGLYFVLSKNGS